MQQHGPDHGFGGLAHLLFDYRFFILHLSGRFATPFFFDNSPMRMKRRRFIVLSGLGATLLGWPSSGCHQRSRALDKTLAEPYMLLRICDANTLRDLGANYRQAVQQENSRQELTDMLLSEESGKSGIDPGDSAALQALLEKKIHADFLSGNTITLRGWVLARTEARQCALFSLQPNNAR